MERPPIGSIVTLKNLDGQWEVVRYVTENLMQLRMVGTYFRATEPAENISEIVNIPDNQAPIWVVGRIGLTFPGLHGGECNTMVGKIFKNNQDAVQYLKSQPDSGDLAVIRVDPPASEVIPDPDAWI